MSKTYELQGKVYSIGEIQQVTENFKKREFVVTVTEENNGKMYVQHIKLETIQKKTESLDYISIGDDVKVDFVVTGRTWTGDDGVEKVFTTLKAIYVQAIREANHAPENTSDQVSQSTIDGMTSGPEENDGLPF